MEWKRLPKNQDHQLGVAASRETAEAGGLVGGGGSEVPVGLERK
jgi:hypothetical protein